MTRRWVAGFAWLVTSFMTVAWGWVIIEGQFMSSMMAAVPAEQRAGLTQGWWIVAYAAMAGIAIVTLANATVGLLLAMRTGGGRMGAILLAAALAFAAVPFGYAVGGSLALRDPIDPIANALYLLGPASYALAYSFTLPVVALTFPDGRLPSERWRLPSAVATGALVAAAVLVVLTPGGVLGSASTNPFGVNGLPSWLTNLAGPLNVIGSLLISVLGTAAVVARYRRGSGLERQQLQWLVAAVFLAAAPFTYSIVGGGPAALLLAFPGVILIPVAVWIAVTRHGLYEIDRLLSRGLSWAIVSGLLVAVYVAAVLVLQTVLGRVTQGETLAVAGSTLVAAALFQPLRRRVQDATDRRFNRSRYDAQGTASAFAGRLRDQVDLDAIVGDMRTVVEASVHPAELSVWIRSRNETRTQEG